MWIAANVGTIVGANAVVTKSFSEGNCIIAGNSTKKIKEIKNAID